VQLTFGDPGSDGRRAEPQLVGDLGERQPFVVVLLRWLFDHFPTQILGVPNSFVYALARRGELPTVRIGQRYVRFRLDAIETWIAEHETLERRGTQ
jgi:excisionase family DNA binding protein